MKKTDLEQKVKELRKENRKIKKNHTRQGYELKYYKSHYGQELKKRYNNERFIEEIKSSLSVIKPLKPYTYKTLETEHEPQDLVLLFSDTQIGEKVQKKETGYADYNIDIFKERLENLYISILNITERHRKDCPIDTLNVFMLGDMVEGRQIYRGQSARITTDVVEQMFEGQEAIANFLRSLAPRYKKINVPTVPGNHGRIGRKDEELTYANWDYVMYRNMAQILSNVKNIEFNTDQTWWKIVDVQGWKFHLEHGDNTPKYLRMPWYGIQRNDGETLMMMQALNKSYDYYVTGHFHEAFEWDRPRGERIGNGSFCSGNQFAMSKLKVTTRPTQKLFGVHKEVGITFRYNIRLDLPKKYIK